MRASPYRASGACESGLSCRGRPWVQVSRLLHGGSPYEGEKQTQVIPGAGFSTSQMLSGVITLL